MNAKKRTQRIGLLTSGGDCAGLNAVIRAVVRKGIGEYGDEIVGFRDGWRGVLEGDTVPMDLRAVRGILPRGGTVLGTSRTNPYALDGGPERVRATLERLLADENRVSPVFSFAGVVEAAAFARSLPGWFEDLRRAAESTTRHGRLLRVDEGWLLTAPLHQQQAGIQDVFGYGGHQGAG